MVIFYYQKTNETPRAKNDQRDTQNFVIGQIYMSLRQTGSRPSSYADTTILNVSNLVLRNVSYVTTSCDRTVYTLSMCEHVSTSLRKSQMGVSDVVRSPIFSHRYGRTALSSQ